MSVKPGLLMFYPYMEVMAAEISDRFELVRMWLEEDEEKALAEKGGTISAVITTGHDYAIDDALFDKLPKLKVVVAVGSGYARVDVAAARARGITVANAGDTHSGDVANHAITLAFALVQDVVAADDYVRGGSWMEHGFPERRRALSAEKFGILGLGRIGRAVADRLEGFGVEIAWHGPNKQSAPWPRKDSALELARWCSVLVVAARGDALGMVNREVIDAVGADGYIVNISRGGVIDEDAMIEALQEGRLAGAGLDVFMEEPTPPDRWKDVPNVIMSAHMAGQTLEAMERLRHAAAANLKTALDGGKVVNEVLT